MGRPSRFADDRIEQSVWAKGREWLVAGLITGLIVGCASTYVLLRFGGVF